MGIQIKLLDFVSLTGETSGIISNSIIEILKNNNLYDKLIAVCTGNANTDFGGVLRKGTNNVHYKLKNNLQKLVGLGQ